jgi:hypothetical protein
MTSALKILLALLTKYLSHWRSMFARTITQLAAFFLGLAEKKTHV